MKKCLKHLLKPYSKFLTKFEKWFNSWFPYSIFLYLITFNLAILFWYRIISQQAWFILAYALAIYHLNLVIRFFTPKKQDCSDLNNINLQELRALSLSKLWFLSTLSTSFALISTLFDSLEIPVFGSILIVYFVILLAMSCRRLNNKLHEKYGITSLSWDSVIDFEDARILPNNYHDLPPSYEPDDCPHSIYGIDCPLCLKQENSNVVIDVK